MSTAVFRSGTPSLSIPQTQNTALVLEFNCLYTHDVRKKSKKWQDGFLRFHTFNKRIMVYDVPRNFVGDVHWKSSAVVQEGDEITLNDGTVIVEVGESVGSTQTDLTELKTIAKRSTRPNGHSSSPVRPPIPGNINHPPSASRSQPQLKHRSLNALLGDAKGQVGRASLPTVSPFEMRNFKDENASPDRAPPAKRLKSIHDGMRTPTSSRSAQQPAVARSSSFGASRRHQSNATSESTENQTRHVIDLSNDVVEPKSMGKRSSEILNLDSSSLNKQRNPNSRTRASNTDERRHSGTSARMPDSRKLQDTATNPDEMSHHSPFFTGERGTLQIAPFAPKRRTLLCESQLSSKFQTTSTAGIIRSQRQVLQERLDRMSKKSRKPSEEPSVATTDNAPEQFSDESTRQITLLENQIRPAQIRKDLPSHLTTPGLPQSVPEDRTLHRTSSASDTASLTTTKPARETGAPVRISAPSRTIPQKPGPPSPETGTVPQQAQAKRKFQSPRSKKALQRSVSLNMTGSGTSTVMLRRAFQAPTAPKPPPPPPEPPVQPDAWSREAFDLFEWRPPDWDEDKWCFKDAQTILPKAGGMGNA